MNMPMFAMFVFTNMHCDANSDLHHKSELVKQIPFTQHFEGQADFQKQIAYYR